MTSGLDVQTSVLICFEDVFPHITREHVKDDTDFLLNLTNNGWFGESAAQWQHAANAVFRAIENGLPLVRCANNGLTCWVDRRGAMSQVYFGDSSDIYQAGYKIVNVPLLPAGKWPATFYRKRGDWFGWTCAGVTAVALMATFLVGVSRVYMGVHYPTDVLAGWAIGLAWALLCGAVAQMLQHYGLVERAR